MCVEDGVSCSGMSWSVGAEACEDDNSIVSVQAIQPVIQPTCSICTNVLWLVVYLSKVTLI